MVFCVVAATVVCWIVVVALMVELMGVTSSCSKMCCSAVIICWVSKAFETAIMKGGDFLVSDGNGDRLRVVSSSCV